MTGQISLQVKTGERSSSRRAKRWRSFAKRYGLAVVAIVITLGISILLTRSSISINLSLLVAVAILIPTWYGGRGPGLFVVFTFQAITIFSKPPAMDASLVTYVITHVSVVSVFAGLVLLVASRRNAEKKLRKLNATLEQRVADRTAQLEAAYKELESFSYSVSHDLRAPLRHINGFSLALLEDHEHELDETGKYYLAQVREASTEMGTLIDDVLNLARLSRSEMRRESLDLSEMAEAIVNDLRRGDPTRDVVVEIQPNLKAFGDRGLVGILLTNLLSNSWKFSSKVDKPRIVFGMEITAGRREYFVRDNGAGFDLAYADKLFGVFQRLHSTAEFEGSGIGLATVQRIVNRHEGRVWAESAVDKGATFYFTLPGEGDPEDEK